MNIIYYKVYKNVKKKRMENVYKLGEVGDGLPFL